MIEVKAFIDESEAQKIAQAVNRPKDSETAKHRVLVLEYCQGNGVDLGSSGDPVVPHAIQVELPEDEWHKYNVTRPADNTIHWRGSAISLPFKDNTLDFVHASHLLEDWPEEEWAGVLGEWNRVLKPGGCLIIAVPDHERFRERVRKAREEHGIDVDNLSHKHESRVGELPEKMAGYETLFDGFVSDSPDEYSVLYVGRKPRAEWMAHNGV